MITAAQRRTAAAPPPPVAIYLLWATLAVYAVTLSFGYVFDDDLVLPRIAQYHWWQFFLGVDRRPLTLWSYELAQSTAVQHAINIGLHLANGALFYDLLRRWSAPPAAALVALAVFLLHPLQVETVAYVSGRADLLIALGFLIAVLGISPRVCTTFYGVTSSAPPSWKLVLLGVGILLAAKPSGVFALLPVLLLSLHVWPRPRWSLLRATLAIGFGGITGILIGNYLLIRGVLDLYGWDWQSRVAMQLAGVVRWLMLIVLPMGLTADHNLQATSTLIVEYVVPVVVLLVIMSWRWLPQSRLLWIWLAVTLGWRVLLPSSEWLSEGDGYLPMLGVAVAIGVVIDSVWSGAHNADPL